MSAHHSTAVRAVAYYRKSNTDDGKSVSQQRDWALSACKAENLDLAAEFTDQSKPGHETARRTEFLRMIEFCEAELQAGRPVGAVVCWAADRFSRSDSFETGAFIWRLIQADVGKMLTASEGWIDFSDSNARIIFNITQDTGRHQYVRSLAQATLRGRIDAAKQGRWMGGAPFGYRTIDGRLAVNEEEAAHVRWIFTHYAETEDGMLRIAKLLNERGVPSPSGKTLWTATAVLLILRSAAYLGDTIFGRRLTGKFFAMVDLKPTSRPSGRRIRQTRQDEDGCIVTRNTHPALVDRETWDRCQVKRKRLNGRGCGPRRGGRIYLFAGLLVCAHCGRRMCGRVYPLSNGKSFQTYLCASYNENGSDKCGRHSMPEEELLRGVAKRIAEKFSDPDDIRAGLVQMAAETGEQRDEAAVKRQARIAELRRVVDRSAKRFLSLEDEDAAEACRKQLEASSADLKALEREQAQAAPALPSVEEQVETAMEFHRRFQDALGEMDAPSLRQLLLEFISYIELHFATRKAKVRSVSHFVRGMIYRRVEADEAPREMTTALMSSNEAKRCCHSVALCELLPEDLALV